MIRSLLAVGSSVRSARAPRPSLPVAAQVALRVRPPVVLLGGLLLIAVTLLGGLLSRFVLPYGGFAYHLLDMDGERSIPAVVSGALLLSGGLLALFAVLPTVLHRLLGIGLVYAALDEVFALHEHLQRMTGVNWIVLYLPVSAACLVVATALLVRLRTEAPRSVPFLIAGSLCWMVAQAFEWLEWHGTDVAGPGYVPMMFAEETLEDLGSLLICLAVIVLGRAAAARGTLRSPSERPAR